MLRPQLPPPKPLDPNQVLTGKCLTCGTVVNVRRSEAVPPQTGPRMTFGRHRRQDETTGPWQELWSVECKPCKAASPTLNGTRVYLMARGNG